MQEPSYLGKVALISIWFRMVFTQTKTQVYKDSHLEIPTKYQYLTDVTTLIPSGRSLDTIIDVDY